MLDKEHLKLPKQPVDHNFRHLGSICAFSAGMGGRFERCQQARAEWADIGGSKWTARDGGPFATAWCQCELADNLGFTPL